MINLPEFKIHYKSSGINRFGFYNWLIKNSIINSHSYIRCNWEHGWQDDEFILKNITLYKSWINRRITQIVTSEKKKSFLINNGFNDIHVAPLPFYFFWKDFNAKKIYNKNNDLLVLPNKIRHTSEINEEIKNLKSYFDYIESFKKSFENIYISIPFEEYKNDFYKELIKKYDFKIIQGVSPFDQNGYLRVLAIFDYFNLITSQGMGSHFIYAQIMKKKISVCGPLSPAKRINSKFYLDPNCPINKNKLMEEFEYVTSKDYIKKYHNYLIKESPLHGTCDFDWAYKNIGENKNISNNEISRLLKTNFFGQCQNYLKILKKF